MFVPSFPYAQHFDASLYGRLQWEKEKETASQQQVQRRTGIATMSTKERNRSTQYFLMPLVTVWRISLG